MHRVNRGWDGLGWGAFVGNIHCTLDGYVVSWMIDVELYLGDSRNNTKMEN